MSDIPTWWSSFVRLSCLLLLCLVFSVIREQLILTGQFLMKYRYHR